MTDSDTIRSREALFSFFIGLDGKRPGAWAFYGYKQALTFNDFQLAYDRGGAVHRLLDGCWQKLPRIKQPKADKESQWEAKAMLSSRRSTAGRSCATLTGAT